MAQKVIITDYPDGSRVISNIRNKKGVPVFRENDTYTATRVTEWFDGSPMDDSKADGKVYLKHIQSGDFYLVNLPNWGETFLQKPNVASLRAMSSTEILLLRIGYYKGVKLNGYYAKGDTPAPIEYYISDTEEQDDSGSVISIGDIKLKHEFKDGANVLYFGARNNAVRFKITTIQDESSITSNHPNILFRSNMVGQNVRIINVFDTSINSKTTHTISAVSPDGKSATVTPSISYSSTDAILFYNRMDSGQAIQNAGNYAIRNNVSLIIPSGNYFLGTAFNINGTGTSTGYLDDDSRVQLKLHCKDVELYYDDTLNYGGTASLSMFGFTQVKDIIIKGLTIRGWNNNYKWFNYTNSHNPPAPVSESGQALFRIMGFNNLILEDCTFDEMGGSIAIMGADKPFNTVEPNQYIKSGKCIFKNNFINNVWQISMTRGRGQDYILEGNIFTYVAHKFYSTLNHVGNHVYTSNIFKNCPRVLFGVNDGVIFNGNVLDCVVRGIEIQLFNHVNYYDYGRKNYVISNNIFNNTSDGIDTLTNVTDHTSSTTRIYGKNALWFTFPAQYQSSGVAKLKNFNFIGNVLDLKDSAAVTDAIIAFSGQVKEIESLNIINNVFVSTSVGNGVCRLIRNEGASGQITKNLTFKGNKIEGFRNGQFAIELTNLLSNSALLDVEDNYFDAPSFNYPLINMSTGKLKFNRNNVDMLGFSSNNLGVVYLTNISDVDCNDNVINTTNDSSTGSLVYINIATANSNMKVRANRNKVTRLNNIVSDANTYTSVGTGIVEALDNIGRVTAPILTNFSAESNMVRNPKLNSDALPPSNVNIPTGYIVRCTSFNTNTSTVSFIKIGSSWERINKS